MQPTLHKNGTTTTRKQMKFRNDEKHLPYRLMPIHEMSMTGKERGKYEKLGLMLNVLQNSSAQPRGSLKHLTLLQ